MSSACHWFRLLAINLAAVVENDPHQAQVMPVHVEPLLIDLG